MEVNPSHSQALKEKADRLQSSTRGPFASSIAKLSGSSRGIPSEKDFHFYNNFGEFKDPVAGIAQQSQGMLDMIGNSSHIWGKEMILPEDLDDAYDWLVSVNDEVFERFDVSADEFKKLRQKEEETGVRMMSSPDVDGFQLVFGRKKKGLSQSLEKNSVDTSTPAVKVASRDKKAMGATPKVPFHIPTIPRPQDEFRILVNNANQPFDHVWLERSEDGSRFIHPLEKISVLDFVDKNVKNLEPVKPLPLESTPFKLVEEVKDLKELAAKLRGVDEFAVDLEHNHYRSFQGLTCLMQISTRTEDFVVDTLKLRIHIGPYLREIFKDPTKRKVMHGADRDIVWLQRDFGIYVCNMFDTGQASRVLKLERNSLEYLLYHYCGVTANKEYQNADWRLRPLPDEMVRYAREDTHYLLHIYDIMRIKLLLTSLESGNSDALLVEVYQRSYDICMQLYEKEILTENSYLYIYGLQGADFSAQQLAIVAGLCEWRDVVARAEDESTGYILPNKTLLEIAKQMPFTASKLRWLLKSKHPYIERNLNAVVSIIRHSVQNAAAFEAVAENLKAARMETTNQENVVVAEVSEDVPSMESSGPSNTSTGNEKISDSNATHDISLQPKEEALEQIISAAENENVKIGTSSPIVRRSGPGHTTETNNSTHIVQPIAEATVQVLKKPSRAFGALLGSSSTKRKLDQNKKEKEDMKLEQIKSSVDIKLEQIKSSVNLCFHSFSGGDERLQSAEKDVTKMLKSSDNELVAEPAVTSNLEDIISLDNNESNVESAETETEGGNEQLGDREDDSTGSALETDGVEDMSLSDLSSSFKKCFQTLNQTRNSRQAEKPQDSGGFLQLKPFDYEAARKEVIFGKNTGGGLGAEDDNGQRRKLEKGDRKKSSSASKTQKDEYSGDFPQGRRRQAFPATGNRSSTFR